MKHVWTVLCKEPLLEQSNEISLIKIREGMIVNVPENLDRTQPINLPVEMALASLWAKSVDQEEKIRIKVVFSDPEGKKISESEQVLEVPVGAKRARTLINISAISIRGEGEHSFSVFMQIKGKRLEKVANVPLDIVHAVVKKEEEPENSALPQAGFKIT